MLYNFIYWGISPTIFELGTIPLRWYGLLFTTGIIISYWIVRQQFKRASLPDNSFEILTLYVLPGIILGMRLGHFLFYEPDALWERPHEVILPFSFTPVFRFTGYQGLASHGGAIGIFLSLWLFHRKYPNISIWFVLDQLALVTPLAGAFIRLGNLFNSEMIGHPTTVAWAFVFAHVDLLPRHPAQLYESISYLIIFLGLLIWKFRPGIRPPGMLFSLLLIFLFLARFIIEFFKINQVAFENQLALNMGQLLSLPFIGLGIILYFYCRRHPFTIS